MASNLLPLRPDLGRDIVRDILNVFDAAV